MEEQAKARKTCKRWTEEEDQRLLRHITAFPQNLNACAEQETRGLLLLHCFLTPCGKEQEEWCWSGIQCQHLAKALEYNQEDMLKSFYLLNVCMLILIIIFMHDNNDNNRLA